MKFTPASDTAKQEVLEYAKEHLSVEDARKILERHGYFVAHLWHVEDVTMIYECDEDTAQDILFKALKDIRSTYYVWYLIDYFANELDLERK